MTDHFNGCFFLSDGISDVIWTGLDIRKFREVPEGEWYHSYFPGKVVMNLRGIDVKGKQQSMGVNFSDDKEGLLAAVKWGCSMVSLQWYNVIIIMEMMKLDKYKHIPKDLEDEIVRYVPE